MKMIGRKTTSKRNSYAQPPWWSNECHQLKKLKQYQLKRFRFSNTCSSDDFLHYKIVRNQFKAKHKQKRPCYLRDKRRMLNYSGVQFTCHLLQKERLDV